MPIRFRCPHCSRLLGIAKRKAGTQTNCPQCGRPFTVPPDEPDDTNEPLDLDGLDDLLNPAAQSNGAVVQEPRPAPPKPQAVPVVPKLAAAQAAPRPTKPRPVQKPGEDAPLFEEDVDAILGMATGGGLELDEPEPRAKPVSGMDAMSLDDGAGKIVLSSRKATLLVVAVVVLMGIAFAAGFLIASNL